jgi:tRNA A37 methylthiotransferase MiaB
VFGNDAAKESIDVILQEAGQRAATPKLVVTGCLVERYGKKLPELLPGWTSSSVIVKPH